MTFSIRRFSFAAYIALFFQLAPPFLLAYTGVASAAQRTISENRIVKSGEDVWTIASEFNLTPYELSKLNQHYTPGEFLNLPVGSMINTPDSKKITSPAQTYNYNAEHEYTLASRLAQAAGLASADSDAQKNMAIGMAGTAVSEEVKNWFNQFGTARIQLNMDSDLSLNNSSLDVLIPIYDNQKSLLFTQVGVRNKDDRNTINTGAGVRVFNDNWMYGGNVFLDNDLTGKNRRLGIGIESWADYLKLSGNYYFGLTDWHQSRDFADYNERPANGYDLRVEGYLPSWPQLGGKLMYEKYYGEEVALFNKNERQKNPSALTLGLNWTPFPLLTLGAEHRAGSNGNNDSQLNMALTVRPGDSLASHLDSSLVAASRLLKNSRTDLVERNNNIVMDYSKQDLVSLTLPTALSGPAGTELTVQAVLKSKYDVRHIDWQAPNLVADGGKLLVKSTDTLSITLPRSSHSLPYVLTGVAHDVKGNTSDRVVTYITVTDAPVSTTNSIMTIIPAVLPADGESRAIVKLQLRNSAGVAVSGQESSLSLSAEMKNSNAPVLLRSMSARSFTVGTFKETNPGDYEAALTAGTQQGELEVTTHWNDTLLKASIVKQVNPDSDGDGIFDKDEIANGTDPFDPNDPGSTIKKGDLTVVVDNATANGSDTNLVKATVTDVTGKPLPKVHVNFSADNNAIITSRGTTDDQGSIVMPLTSLKVGTSKITASVNGKTQVVNVTFKAGPGKPGSGSVGGNGSGAVANGTDKVTVTFPVTDAAGNPAAGQTVDITITYPDGSKDSQQVVTDQNGNAVIDVDSTQAGNVNVEASTGSGSGNTDISFVADSTTATLPATGGLEVVVNNAVANGNSTNSVRAKVVDAQGNAVPNIVVGFSASNGATIATTGMTDSKGEVIQTLTNNILGVVVVTATVNGVSRTVNVTFNADSSSATLPATGGLAVLITGALANGTATNSVLTKVIDNNGNPLEGILVNFSATNGATIAATGTTDANGEITQTLTSTTAGTSTVTATVNGTSRTADVTFVADSSSATLPATGGLTVVSTDAAANGTATNSVRATVTDANGNPVSGLDVSFSATNGATIAATGTTDANGEITQTLTSTTAGTSTVTATVNGTSRTADVTFVADSTTATLPATGGLTVVSTDAAADGTATNSVRATVTDANGNPVSGLDVSFSATNGATIAATGTTDVNGEITQTLTSTTAGTSTVTATVNGTSRTVDVSFVDEIPMDGSTPLLVNGATFTAASGFPRTGFVSASFQIGMDGNIANNSMYDWSTDQPSFVSVGSNGYVTFTGTATTNNKTVVIKAKPKSGGLSKTYTFTLERWFIHNDTSLYFSDAQQWCVAQGYQMNSENYVTDQTSSADNGNVSIFGNRTATSGAKLWSEWGNLHVYSDWITSNYPMYFYGVRALSTNRGMYLYSDVGRTLGASGTSNMGMVICSKAL